MSHAFHRRHGSHPPKTPSPLRHASYASNSSDDEHVEPITPTRSSRNTSNQKRVPSGTKRPIRDTSPTKQSPNHDYHYTPNERRSARKVSSERTAMRTLAQAPSMLPSPLQPKASVEKRRARFEEAQHNVPQPAQTPAFESDAPPPKPNFSMALSRSDSKRGPTRQGSVRGKTYEGHEASTGIIDSTQLEKLGKSTTGHLRTLSKLANNHEEDFQIASPEQEVAGMHGRRRLQRDASTRKKPSSAPGYGGRTWMDTQRQFLAAYEYLCHIGEAKEWIEDIIQKPIPPIVQLEEALRDGVTLAEVVQAMKSEKPLRIFRNAKLQFRHSDNIALFFKFLAEIELPELFRFELVDLYEKKNIPKVIYCIHAVSWLLFRKGMVDFRIGNLVGQLEFEHHELEAMQKGLDKAGVSMPNFSGMGANFGAEPEPEPEPEPVETDEERQAKELTASESAILDLQSQIRGVLVRIKLGDTMQDLWDWETFVTDLQSRVRGDMARQISGYHMEMREFATNLQSVSRGYLIRAREKRKADIWKDSTQDILTIQNLFRARKARVAIEHTRTQLHDQQHGIRQLQSIIRGSLQRKQAAKQDTIVRQAGPAILGLQAAIRGLLARDSHEKVIRTIAHHSASQISLQAVARAFLARQRIAVAKRSLHYEDVNVVELQAALRGWLYRQAQQEMLTELRHLDGSVIDLQTLARAHLSRRKVKVDMADLQRSTSSISTLQSMIRAQRLRRETSRMRHALQVQSIAIVGLQSLARACLQRDHVAKTLDEMDDQEEQVVELQSSIRAVLVRYQFAEKKSYIRARQQGKQYKSLTSGKNPPVGTVKNFVHLLNDNNFDFDVEFESEKLQKLLLQRIQENEQKEQFIAELDVKIGLLAHTKIESDEKAKLKKQWGMHMSNSLSRGDSVRDSFNLKALNKNSRAKLDRYQEMFFILQTQPQYLARLFRRLRENSGNEQDARLDSLVMNTFGFVQKNREEYYFLKLLSRSIKEELDTSSSLSEFLRGNMFFAKLFVMYTRVPRDRKYLRQLLGPLIRSQIIENPQLDLESDPLSIYRAAINDEELRTGHRSSRNPDLPREEAIRDPQTREAFIHHLQDLRDIADQFLAALEESVTRIPYGTRCVAQQMFTHLRQRFPDETEESHIHAIGNWIWKNYLKPALAEPESTGVVDRGLDATQKRNLCELTKVINQVAKAQLFGSENVYLQPLNSYVTEAITRLTDIWADLIMVAPPEENFDISEFNDLSSKVKPTLYIKMADVFAMHHTISNHVSSICVSAEDSVLTSIIQELGNAKHNETEMSAGCSEVALQLSAKGHIHEDPDAEVKALMMEAKRCILYIIRIQNGANLMEIFVKPISPEDEARWASLVQEELSAGRRKRRAYSDNSGSTNASSLVDIAAMSYGDLKRVALENIVALEAAGRLNRGNQYQDILNEIAVDIRNKHRRRLQRQKELDTLRSTIGQLEEKQIWLEDKLKTYNDTYEQNVTTLQTKKGKKRFLIPFSKQYNHERELARLGRIPEFGSWKYRAADLAAKGILIAWNGHDLRTDDLTISSDKVNVFLIEGSKDKFMIPGASAEFTWDELLEGQYIGQDTVDFFDAAAGHGLEQDSDRPSSSRSRGPGRRQQGVLTLDRRLFMQWLSKKFWPEG